MELPRQQVREVVCEGSPFQMGLAQGAALQENIHQAMHAVEELEAFRLLKPAYLPWNAFLKLAEFRAVRFLQRALATTQQATLQRLRGISQGAGVPLRKLALCGMLEAVLSDLTSAVTHGPNGLNAGCSAIAVTRDAAAARHPMIAHNFDYVPAVQPFYFIRRCHPTGMLRSLEFSMTPLAGAVDGINEAGLAIACNYAYVTDRMVPAPTITMLIAELLAKFRTLDEAADYLARAPRVGGGLLMMADRSGAIASIEISNSRITRRDPTADRLFHTNRLQTTEMTDIELPQEAHYGSRSPTALRGRRVHQSADRRITMIESRLAELDTVSRTDLHRIMSDHGEGPSGDSVCMHGGYWHTTACLQLFPEDRQLRASFSTACSAEFADFTLLPADGNAEPEPDKHSPGAATDCRQA